MATSPGMANNDDPPRLPPLPRLGKPHDEAFHALADLPSDIKHSTLLHASMSQSSTMSQSPRPHTPDDRENQPKTQTSLGRWKRGLPFTPRLSSSSRLQHITLPRTSSLSGAIPHATPLKLCDPPVSRPAESTSPGSHPTRQRRRVEAEVDYRPGDTIMRAPILFAALNSSALASHCSGCFQSRRADDACSFLPCSRCKLVVFCSVRCYAQSAEAHFPECRAMARSGKAPPAEVRLIAKALQARAAGKYMMNPVCLEPVSQTSSSLTETINDLNTFLDDMGAGGRMIKWKKYRLAGEGIGSFARQAVAIMFPLRDGRDRQIGVCLTRDPSQIGHSCSPNALFHFPEGPGIVDPIHITALRGIRTGDEITISYLDQGLPCHLRSGILAQQGFEHDCHDCERTLRSVDMRYSTRHVPCPSQGLIPMTREPLPGPGSVDRLSPSDVTCSGCDAELNESETRAKPILASTMLSLASDGSAFWQMPTERGDYRERIDVLSDLLASFKHDQYLETIHPLPQMRHLFAALVVLCDPPNMDSLQAAIEELVKGYKGYREAYGDQARPVTVNVLLQYVEAEIATARIYEKELVEAKRRIAKRARRRSAAKRWEPYGVRRIKVQPAGNMESNKVKGGTSERAVKMERTVTLMGLDRLARGDESSEEDEPWSNSGPSIGGSMGALSTRNSGVKPRATFGTLGLGQFQREIPRQRKMREILIDIETHVGRAQAILSQAREERLELLGRSDREDVMGKLLDEAEGELREIAGEAGLIVFD